MNMTIEQLRGLLDGYMPHSKVEFEVHNEILTINKFDTDDSDGVVTIKLS